MNSDQHPRILEITHIFRSIPEATWDVPPGSGSWTPKQILGHLIDSAANNLQRFVRIQFEQNPVIYYDQDQWVNVSHYTQYDITQLIDLWLSWNLHLLHIISHVPSTAMQRSGSGADGVARTLEWYIKDYFYHLEHHLSQIQAN